MFLALDDFCPYFKKNIGYVYFSTQLYKIFGVVNFL